MIIIGMNGHDGARIEMRKVFIMKKIYFLTAVFVCALFSMVTVYAQADTSEEIVSSNAPMTNQRLDELIRHVDNDAQGQLGRWSLTIEGVGVQVVTDERANRMRIISPILKTDNLDEQTLYRLLQANFDTVLDARYAIANGILWSTFIHPLSQLDDEDFLVGMGQTVNAVITYGSTFSSGVLSFQGGDSQAILRRNLIDKLKKKGKEI